MPAIFRIYNEPKGTLLWFGCLENQINREDPIIFYLNKQGRKYQLKMRISLYKYKCQLNIDGSIVSTFHINEQLYDEIMDALANQPAVFPVRFTFCRVNKLDGIMAQLLILRNVKRYKVIVRENFILLIRRKNRKRPQEEFVFWDVLLIEKCSYDHSNI